MKKRPHSRGMGLARTLSKLGYCSRSAAAKLICAGRVTVNGNRVRDPEAPVSIRHEQIAVDGSAVEEERKIYLMLNKPRGVVTSASDEKGRQTVYALLYDGARAPKSSDGGLPWVAPVGRLDKASEGLLLLTNDFGWGARIAAPETHVNKTYHVQIATVADEDFILNLV
ncbi:MAG: pseudouridine synthase, partial [Candidatus Sulfotelmatobacter sp.]